MNIFYASDRYLGVKFPHHMRNLFFNILRLLHAVFHRAWGNYSLRQINHSTVRRALVLQRNNSGLSPSTPYSPLTTAMSDPWVQRARISPEHRWVWEKKRQNGWLLTQSWNRKVKYIICGDSQTLLRRPGWFLSWWFLANQTAVFYAKEWGMILLRMVGGGTRTYPWPSGGSGATRITLSDAWRYMWCWGSNQGLVPTGPES